MTTRKPNKTKLEFSVEGNLIGELTMEKGRESHTRVYEGSVVNFGTYPLNFQDVQSIALNRLERDYPKSKIEITKLKL